MKLEFRMEKDVLGELKVPSAAYWGINTQRAIENFKISDIRFPTEFIIALAQVKKACLQANFELKLIGPEMYEALQKAVNELLDDCKHFDQFPIDIFQTGSGTQTNMNMNEVLANRANEILGFPMGKKHPIHPNDHVNKSQSSNDVIPTTMHVSTLNIIFSQLIPTLDRLIKTLADKITEFEGVVKVGRTHLQDAVPIPFAMEFEVYKRQILTNLDRIKQSSEELFYLPIGGTALGTGINAHKDFAKITVNKLSEITKFNFKMNPIKAEGIASHNSFVRISGTLRVLALSLLKMANDIRWMGSGPRAGLGELNLPANEPGSSIMPGKINPTQSEALIQVCLQVIGNDSTVSLGEGFGSNLDLNVCKPLIIVNILESIKILSGGVNSFIGKCLKDLSPNIPKIQSQLNNLLMLVTNLTPIIGYDKASEIAQIAFKEGKSIKEVVKNMNLDLGKDLDELLDPKNMI